MTKKDYVLIARVFAREVSLAGGDERGRRYILGGIARLLATELEQGNPRFDRQRFLAACGVA